jgi:hypothetical protein
MRSQRWLNMANDEEVLALKKEIVRLVQEVLKREDTINRLICNRVDAIEYVKAERYFENRQKPNGADA